MAYDYDDASSQYITFGDITFLDGLSTISGHCWVNLDDIDADHYLYSKITTGGLFFLFDDVGSASGRTNTFTILVGDGAVSAKIEGATNAASAGTWISVGFSWESGSATGLRLYINGSEDANGPVSTATQGTFPNLAGGLDVGRSSSGGGYMDGQIGGCALWDTVLSAADFAALANYYDPQLIKPQNLLWAPRFIRGALDPITGASGTITGATVADHHSLIHPVTPIVSRTTAGITESIPSSNLVLSTFTPTVTVSTLSVTESIPSSTLRLTSFPPRTTATGLQVTKREAGGKRNQFRKRVIINGNHYTINSYTELRSLLNNLLKNKNQEIQQIQAKSPKRRKRIKVLQRHVVEIEKEIAKVDSKWHDIQKENEEILLLLGNMI